MPTILRIGPYRFLFFSADQLEPPHVHVKRDACEAKFWLAPVRRQSVVGFGRTELNRIERLVRAHEEDLREAWNEHFGV
jgi:hypothetical protein